MATAFGNFYTDRDGIQTELVRTWAYVVQAFAGAPAVAGYYLLNGPGIGANPPISSGLLLIPEGNARLVLEKRGLLLYK